MAISLVGIFVLIVLGANAMIKGLTSQGRDVWDIGLVTSDMIYFAAGKYGLAGGAVVTASHNPILKILTIFGSLSYYLKTKLAL